MNGGRNVEWIVLDGRTTANDVIEDVNISSIISSNRILETCRYRKVAGRSLLYYILWIHLLLYLTEKANAR